MASKQEADIGESATASRRDDLFPKAMTKSKGDTHDFAHFRRWSAFRFRVGNSGKNRMLRRFPRMPAGLPEARSTEGVALQT